MECLGLYFVPKANGALHPSGDIQALNACTIPDRYSLPLVTFFAARNIFNNRKIKAYHQIPVVPKTAMTTPLGLFEFNFVLFGQRNSFRTLKRFIHKLLLLNESTSLEEHHRHLEVVFRLVHKNGIMIHPSKYQLAEPELKFMGHLITQEDILPLSGKIDSISRTRDAK